MRGSRFVWMVDSPEYGDRSRPGKTGAWLVLTALLVAAGCQPVPPPAPPPPMAADLWADLSYLGDPARQGRQLGSDGRDSAAAYIAGRFRDAGLRPVPEPDCAWDAVCESSYSWRFPVRLIRDPATGINVAGMVPGTDPVLSDEFVVVGAHYDHIGRLRALSRDPRASGIRPGADDNASGTAGMLELARRVARDPLPRTVLFVAFDAEEIGLYGSEAFVDHPPVPLHRIVAMLNLDMVGRLSQSRLTVAGVGSDDRFRPMLERLNAAGPKLDLTLRGSGSGSDHVSFLQASVPALHFFTGLHADYHTRSDRVEKINVPGMLRVLELAEGVLRELAGAVGEVSRSSSFKLRPESKVGRTPAEVVSLWSFALALAPPRGPSCEPGEAGGRSGAKNESERRTPACPGRNAVTLVTGVRRPSRPDPERRSSRTQVTGVAMPISLGSREGRPGILPPRARRVPARAAV